MENEAKLKDTEEKRLESTIEIVEKQIKSLTRSLENLHKTITDPYTQVSLQKVYSEKKDNLERSRQKPYFARIDFKEKKTGKTSEIYIGKTNIEDEDRNLVVIDWRAPIASLYYDARLGETTYNAPAGKIQGDLLLKRLFEIEHGKLEGFSDTDISINDELLKPYLTSNSESRLKNIIATIQTEQNAIIRAPLMKPLIIQGVAGSGKTTVALHRIAYLTYTYAKQLKPEDFMIIAPSKFFLDYISNILPDLGVNDVRQCTFEEFARQIIDEEIKIESSTEKLADIVNNKTSAKEENTQMISEFKSSLIFKRILDKYLENIEEHYLPEGDLRVGDIVILSHEKLVENFRNCLPGKPLEEKMKMFKARLKMFFENNQDFIEDMIRKKRSREIEAIDKELSADEYKKKKLEIFAKYDEPLELIKNNGKKLIDGYTKKVKKSTPLVYYKDFISKLPQYIGDIDIDSKIISDMQEKLIGKKKGKQIEYEDLAPLMYIANRIRGTKKQIKDNQLYPKHIVIDEAQDYSPFQFFVLQDILKSNSMTILGDISQGIYSYRGTKDWQEINDKIFGGEATVLDLSKSYRTTMEIMEKGNDVIDKVRDRIHIRLAEPVIRKGDPVVIAKQEEKQLASVIANRINELIKANRTNIAVITKTLQEAMDLYKKITKQGIDITLISDKSEEYKGGISIIPSYLVQ